MTPLVSYEVLWAATFGLVVGVLVYAVGGALRDWWRGRMRWSPERRKLDELGRHRQPGPRGWK